MKHLRWLAGLVWFAVLATLYAVVRVLSAARQSTARTVALCVVFALGGVVLYQTRCCTPSHPLRIATYNIRRFGVEPTDMDRLATVVSRLEADVIAVQEVEREPALTDLESRLAARTSRRYAHVLAACGGRSGMLVGFLYDTRRVTLVSTREYPELDPEGEGRCGEGDRAGLLGVFAAGPRVVHLLSVHLSAGSERERVERRRAQWLQAHTIAAALRRDGARAVAILGDTNSTGYLDNADGERDFIQSRARAAGMDVVTHPVACSEYWSPRNGVFEPSLLDHVVATPGMARDGSVRVHGYCVELACASLRADVPPDEYAHVSDHCPVTFDVAP